MLNRLSYLVYIYIYICSFKRISMLDGGDSCMQWDLEFIVRAQHNPTPTSTRPSCSRRV